MLKAQKLNRLNTLNELNGVWFSVLQVGLPSLKCFDASAHQSSLYGSGPGSRRTFATASSTFCTASSRQDANVAASAHPCSSKLASATFKQSRPTGDAFNFGSI